MLHRTLKIQDGSELMDDGEDYFRMIEFKIYIKSYVTYLIKRNWFQKIGILGFKPVRCWCGHSSKLL